MTTCIKLCLLSQKKKKKKNHFHERKGYRENEKRSQAIKDTTPQGAELGGLNKKAAKHRKKFRWGEERRDSAKREDEQKTRSFSFIG